MFLSKGSSNPKINCVVTVLRDRDWPGSKTVRYTAQTNSAVLFWFLFVCHLMSFICIRNSSSFQLDNAAVASVQPLTKCTQTSKKKHGKMQSFGCILQNTITQKLVPLVFTKRLFNTPCQIQCLSF